MARAWCTDNDLAKETERTFTFLYDYSDVRIATYPVSKRSNGLRDRIFGDGSSTACFVPA